MQYYESKMFPHTFFIEFQNQVNFEELEERQKTKAILNKQRLVLLPAYNTNCVLMRYQAESESPEQRNDWYFNENGLCQKGSLIYMFKFKSHTSFNNNFSKGKLEKYEECFNLDLVSSKIGAIDDNLLLGIIRTQKGILTHFVEQYFPLLYMLFTYFMYFVNLLLVNSKTKKD